jgi:hypothetical protein
MLTSSILQLRCADPFMKIAASLIDLAISYAAVGASVECTSSSAAASMN